MDDKHRHRSNKMRVWLSSLILIGNCGIGTVNAASYMRRDPAGGLSFQLDQIEVKRPNGELHNLAMEVRKTFKKHGIPLTKEMAAAGSQNVSANPEYKSMDRLYLTPIKVGTPPQPLNVQFDTGSSDLWLFSDKLPQSQIKDHKIFNTTSSTTWELIDGATFSIGYDDGQKASGIVGTDVFQVGGLTVSQQGVEAADQVTRGLTNDSPNNGIVGFAFSGGNRVKPTPQQTFFDNIAGSLAKKVFCADLRLHKPGSFSFGTLNTNAWTGFIQYLNVDSSQSAWSVSMTGYAVSGVDSDFNDLAQSAIVDTGTAAFVTDPKIVNAYWGSVAGASLDGKSGLWKYPCSTNLPQLALRFTGSPDNPNPAQSVVDILGKYFAYKTVKGSCYGALISNNGSGLTIFGDPWFKSQYTCFDQSTGSPRIGIIIKDRNW